MRVAYTDHLTNYIVLIQADETQSEIEDAIRDTKYGYDSFRVVPVSDFQWPSAVPDDEKTLRQWLEQRPEWEEWRAAHL